MAGRPKIDDGRDRQYRVRLNDKENEMLNYASLTTGKKKSEIFRQALVDYYQNILVNEFNSEDEDFEWEDMGGISLKRVVKCPYCNSGNGIDFSDYSSESVDRERQMGDEITYNFDVENYKCASCSKVFQIEGFICEYPVGAFNYEEINIIENEEYNEEED